MRAWKRCGGRGGRGARGFTMVEAVATIAVIGALGSVTSGLILRASDGLSVTAGSAERAGQLSLALERAVRAVRGIPLKTGTGARPNIQSLTATDLQWTESGGAARLRLNGSALELTDPGEATAATLLTGVTDLTIQALDESNAALGASLSGSACDPIRRVAITITASAPAGRSETLRTRVFLRAAMSGGAGQ